MREHSAGAGIQRRAKTAGRLRRFGIAALCAALIAAHAPAARAGAPQSDGLDLTPLYSGYIEKGRFARSRIEARFAVSARQLRGVRILIAPSWLSDAALAASDAGLFDFLGEQVAALRAAGLEVALARTDSEGSVRGNGRVLLGQIAESDRPLCLLSHSKGGLDVLEALVRAEDRVLEKVRCWIALQSPFAGSPLADLALENWLLSKTADYLLPALGGTAQSLGDLSVAERRAYLAKNRTRIAEVLQRIAVLSYASFIDADETSGISAGIGARVLSWSSEHDMPSDGLVPVDSAILPGTHYIVAEGVDHNVTVSGSLLLADDFDRVMLLKLLLNLVLSLPENPALKT